MSNWTHPQCEACWIVAELTVANDGSTVYIGKPHRLVDPEVERCCWCGKFTIVGIYRRHDPADLERCRGHDDRTD